ncbi:MAG: acyltransferase [Ignavibacteria bacterium]|nr:acyltransferase [Ignavibacteria bacterium]
MLRKIFGNLLHTLAFVLPFGYSLRPFLHKVRGVKVGKNVWISKYVYIDDNHPECISIGDNSTIGLRTTIFAHTYFGPPRKSNPDKVVIGKNVFIGPHCLILPNVSIGDGSVIKGGTVVTRNVPANTLFGLPSAEPLAHLTNPLTTEYSYEEFVKGIKPIRKKR